MYGYMDMYAMYQVEEGNYVFEEGNADLGRDAVENGQTGRLFGVLACRWIGMTFLLCQNNIRIWDV